MQKTKLKTDWLHPPKNLDIQNHQVDVWRISLDLPTASAKSLASTLSADESQRAARFHFPADRDRYIAAHGCLRDVLARYLDSEPGQLGFSTNPFGKPELKDYVLEFNLSHSGDFALIAVTRNHKVGVDVERIRSDMELESMARRFFSPDEVIELLDLPPEQRVAGFFNCWTRKEAYIKAQGLGLYLPLDSFDVSLTPHEPATLRAFHPDQQEVVRWRLISLDADSRYASAIAVEGQDLKIRFLNWDPAS